MGASVFVCMARQAPWQVQRKRPSEGVAAWQANDESTANASVNVQKRCFVESVWMGTTLRTPLYSGIRNSGTHRFHVLCVVRVRHHLAPRLGEFFWGLQQFNDGEKEELHKIAVSCLSLVVCRDCRDICRGTIHFTVGTVGTQLF